MAFPQLAKEERFGLALAVAAHVGLVALLVLRPPSPAAVDVPERMTVTFADDVALKSTSPQPDADAAPDEAPELAPVPTPPEAAQPSKQSPASKPTPSPRASAVPAPKPSASPAPKKDAKAGGSKIGSDFLKGVPGAQSAGKAQVPPAEAIGPAVRSALAGAISRQLKPNWVAPQGVDADLLVTVLAWDLNPDGTLAGSPRLVRQEGITDANRPQARRHVEQAIRAVRLAAPFDLPAEYYDAWKRVASFRFDRKLSQ